MDTQEEIKNIVSVYKIDKLLFPEGLPNDEIIEKIVTGAKDYKKEESLSNNNDNFSTSMYFAHKSISYKRWEDFFGENIGTDNDTFRYTTLSGEKNEYFGGYLSFVCFFERDDSIFALCTGKGYLVVDKYIESDFGFNLLSRLIKPESTFLKSTTANHLAGGTFENMDFFRSSESFLSQDDFGKIFREAISSLDKEALTKLGIDIKDLNKTSCLVKSSFTLKTGLSFDQIINDVLPAITKLFDDTVNPPNFQINKVKSVSKKNPILYDRLESVLHEKIRNEFVTFDFFPPTDTYLFFSADKYAVIKNGKESFFEKDADDLTNIENVQKVLTENKLLDFDNPMSFNVELNDIMINAYDDQDRKILKSSFSLKRGLHGEFEHEGEKYFWMNGKFWHIDKNFLKSFVERVYKNMSEPSYQITEQIPFVAYNHTTTPVEGAYNASHVGVPGFINLDKKIGLGVELCDLLYETDDTIYLTHVKIGFDRNIRDLTSQILTASRFLFEDQGKNEYLQTVYDHKGNGTDVPCTFEVFCNKFKTKNVVFVCAFIHEDNVFDETVFAELGSNIAKLEMFEIMKDFKKFSPPYSLKIIQLPNTN